MGVVGQKNVKLLVERSHVGFAHFRVRGGGRMCNPPGALYYIAFLHSVLTALYPETRGEKQGPPPESWLQAGESRKTGRLGAVAAYAAAAQKKPALKTTDAVRDGFR